MTERTRKLTPERGPPKSTLPPLYIPGCPHRPTPMQWLALALPHTRELLYGGAAGGGKSDFLLMAALQYIDVPSYSAVIFRRVFPQLAAPEDGMMARAQEWLKPHPDFEGIDSVSQMPTRWKHRSGGTLSFSHLQHEKNKYDHQGPSYQFIGFDELTQFSLSQYLYLMSRLRRLEKFELPLRMRAASNPGGIGHDWVRERFPIPHDGRRRPMAGRTFIPALLQDNPHLDRADYERTLLELHPYERAQLLAGDWDARPPGSRFQREWFNIIDTPPIKATRVRRWDMAATEPKAGRDPDWTVGLRMALTPEKRIVIEDVRRTRLEADELDRLITGTAGQDGREVAIRMEQEGGSSGKIATAHFRRLLTGFDFRGVPSTGSKVVRSNPLASEADAGNVDLVRGDWNEEFFREYEMFPGGSHDDQVDAGSGALFDLSSRGATWEELYPEPVATVEAA